MALQAAVIQILICIDQHLFGNSGSRSRRAKIKEVRDFWLKSDAALAGGLKPYPAALIKKSKNELFGKLRDLCKF